MSMSRNIPVRQTSLPCDGYRLAASEIVSSAKSIGTKGVAAYVRPPLLYYLAASDLGVPIHRLPDEPFGVAQLRPDLLIVTDVATRDSKRILDTVSELAVRSPSSMVGEFTISPHILTMLDEYATQRRLSSRDAIVKVFYFDPSRPARK